MKLVALAFPIALAACGTVTVEKDGTKITWTDGEKTEEMPSEEQAKAFSLRIENCQTIESESIFDESLFHIVLAECQGENQLHKIITDTDFNEVSRERIDPCLSVDSFEINKDFNSISVTCNDQYKENVALNESSAQMHNSSTLTEHLDMLPEKISDINSLFVNAEDVYTIYKGSLQPFSCLRHKAGFEELDLPIKFDNGFHSQDDFAANNRHYLRWDSYTSSFEFGYFEDCKPIKIANHVDLLPQTMKINEFISFSSQSYAFVTSDGNSKTLFIINDGKIRQKKFQKDNPIHINTFENKIILNNADSIEIIQK